jgi:CHAT domain-containing protein
MRTRHFTQLFLFSALLLAFDSPMSPQTNRGFVDLEAKSGTTYRGEIAPGESRSFSLVLTRDKFAQITLDQQGIDLVTSIYDAANKLVHKADWRWSGVESISFVANLPGRYRIEVSPRRRNGVRGAFVLTLVDVRMRSNLDVKWTTVEKSSTQVKADIDKGGSLAHLQVPIDDALAIWQQLNNGLGIAQMLGVRGFVEQAIGKPSLALETYQQALVLRRSHHDTAGEAETLHNIAAAESASGEIRKALDLYQQALEVRRQAGDLEGIPSTLANLGYIRWALGDADEAITVLGDAIQASQHVGDSRLEAQSRINLGATLASVGETEDALIQFRLALSLAKAQRDTRGEAYVLANLGKIYNDFGEYLRALPNLKRASELMRLSGDRRGEGGVLLNIGSAHLFSNEPQAAIDYLEQALAIFRETNNRFLEARARQNLSRVYQALGETDLALKWTMEGLDISRSLADLRGEAAALRNLADIEFSKHDADAALQHLKQARTVFAAIRDKNAEADTVLALARVSSESGNDPLALTQIEEGLKLIESQREKVTSSRLRGSYFASKRQYYDFYINILMPLGTPASEEQVAMALEASERARARLLLDTIPLSRIKINAPTGRNLDNRRRTLHRELNRLAQQLQTGTLTEAETADRNNRLESLLFELDDVQGQILTVDPRYQRLISPRLLRVSEIQRQLDPDTLLLEYSLGEKRSFLWAVTQSSIAAFSNLPSRSEIDQLVRNLYDSFSAYNRPVMNDSAARQRARVDAAYSNFGKTASLLSERLLGPVADRLNAKRLIIVSDGALHFLPFAALPLPGDFSSPLILNHELVNLPSISVLGALRQETRTRAKPSKTLAIIADPVYSPDDPRVRGGSKAAFNTQTAAARSRSDFGAGDDGDWFEHLRGGTGFRRLIYSRQEARSVLSLIPSSQSRVALDFDADIPAVMDNQLASFQIVHFGVHGMVDSVQPSLSSLVLSLVQRDGQPNDGFLRLYQIYNLNLPVDLVVLGACETAMGMEIRGEGIESLARGFMYAGASRLVASLWQVDDESTSELMKAFYRNILKSHVTPATALRLAQLEIMRNPRWRDPYYWAAFVFLGEWR